MANRGASRNVINGMQLTPLEIRGRQRRMNCSGPKGTEGVSITNTDNTWDEKSRKPNKEDQFTQAHLRPRRRIVSFE